jgi:hypothetical protein
MQQSMQYLKTKELDNVSARNLPIESGDGRTPETAYLLQEINQFEAPSLEHLIIDLILKASGYLFWELANQTFTIEEDRQIDHLKVHALKHGETKECSFYFDLTELG